MVQRASLPGETRLFDQNRRRLRSSAPLTPSEHNLGNAGGMPMLIDTRAGRYPPDGECFTAEWVAEEEFKAHERSWSEHDCGCGHCISWPCISIWQDWEVNQARPELARYQASSFGCEGCWDEGREFWRLRDRPRLPSWYVRGRHVCGVFLLLPG